ncbi:MAG: type II toxin-antitoxin system VapC family toxin [Sphingopyxis sp.]
MIAVDTSVLVRYFVQDDAIQAELATQLFEERLTVADPGLITLVSVHETYWTLIRVYNLSIESVKAIIAELLDAPNLVLEHRLAVQNALTAPAGFADALIHFVGASMGASITVTFDKKFARLAGVELLA